MKYVSDVLPEICILLIHSETSKHCLSISSISLRPPVRPTPCVFSEPAASQDTGAPYNGGLACFVQRHEGTPAAPGCRVRRRGLAAN